MLLPIRVAHYFFFFFCYIVFRHIYKNNLTTHSPVDGHAAVSNRGLLCNQAAVKIWVQGLCGTHAFFSPGEMPRSKMSASQVRCMFKLQATARLFSKMVVPFHTSTSCVWEFHFFHNLVDTWYGRLFNLPNSITVSHELIAVLVRTFLCGWWSWACFHRLIVILNIFICEISSQVFCPFFKIGLSVLLLLS